jgi:outer membrane protein, heavy metal efflux system
MSTKSVTSRRSTRILRDLAFAPAAIIAAASVLSAAPAMAQTQAPLTLADAIARAIESDPGLRAAGSAVDAALGGARQARVRPNPTLDLEVENFGGQGDLRGSAKAETTFAISQEFEFAGQRSARMRFADRELHGAELDRVLRGLDLIRDVQLAYFTALAADELVAIEEERLSTAQALNAAVQRRVSAARDPLMAGARAQAGLSEARIALSRAEAEANSARIRLSSYWGGDDRFSLIRAAFEPPLSPDHAHAPPTDESPDIARLTTERDRGEAMARLERSLSYKNPTLSLGYRRFEDRNGDGAVVAGLSMPLGVSDRNQGNVARAQAERERAAYDLEAGRRTLARAYATLDRAIATDLNAVRATENEVIPQAQRALALAQDGYNRGAFSYLDVLEAQRALSDARQRRVDSLRSYYANEAAIDRLTARFAPALPGEEIHK